MSSQHFNDSDHHGLCLDLNAFPSATVPSSLPGHLPPLPNAFGVMGGAGETDPEFSGIEFQGCMVNTRSNNDGYVGSENKKHEHDRGSSAAEKTQCAKVCSRGHWKPDEDDKLKELVALFGPQNWNTIAHHIEGRSGKSCRLRWLNHLDPGVNKRAFTEEEEQKLLAAHTLYGNKWATISTFFPGKSDNAVKNHWHVMVARRQREQQSSGHTRKKSTTFNQSIPNVTASTISDNARTTISTISSNMDDSSSTSSMSFSKPSPVQNHHVYGHGSITGLSSEKRVTTLDSGSVVLEKSIDSNWNSEFSVAESSSLAIPREVEDICDNGTMSFIDFLGVGDA